MTFPVVPFQEAVDDVTSGNEKILRSEFLDTGDLAIVDQGQALIAGYTKGSTSRVKVSGPLIVFGDHTRVFKYVDFPFAMGADGVKLLRSREGFDPKFLYHYLRSCSLPSAGYSRHFKFLKRKCIPRPPLDQQRKISTVLDQIDTIRQGHRKAMEALEVLPQAIFQDMFDSPTLESAPFGDLCERVTVGVVVKPASYYVESGAPALRTLNVKPARLDLEELVYFSEESNRGALAKSLLRSGDLLIARTGNAGTAAVVPEALEGANAVDLIIATPRTDRVHSVFLETLLNSAIGKRIVLSESRG